MTLWDEREETAGGQREKREPAAERRAQHCREREVSHVRDPGEVTICQGPGCQDVAHT